MSPDKKNLQSTSLGTAIPVRTPKAQPYLGEKAAELPKALRLLLLAIDDRQSIEVYEQNLASFGDVATMLAQLAALGLVKILSAAEHKGFENQRASLVSGDKTESIPPEMPTGVASLEQVFRDTQPPTSISDQEPEFNDIIKKYRENQKNKRLNWTLQQAKTSAAQSHGLASNDSTLTNSKIFGLVGMDEWNRLQEQAKGLAQMMQATRAEVDKLRVKLYRSKAKRSGLEQQLSKLRRSFFAVSGLLVLAVGYIAWKLLR